jgi:predicted ribosome quality control (RQC) complex YloA/Tae2 family protein
MKKGDRNMETTELDYFYVQQLLQPKTQIYWREFSSFMNVDLFVHFTENSLTIEPVLTEIAYFELTAILYIKEHAFPCKTLDKIHEIDVLPEHRIRKIINPSTSLFYDDFFTKKDIQQLHTDLFSLLNQQLAVIVDELKPHMKKEPTYT